MSQDPAWRRYGLPPPADPSAKWRPKQESTWGAQSQGQGQYAPPPPQDMTPPPPTAEQQAEVVRQEGITERAAVYKDAPWIENTDVTPALIADNTQYIPASIWEERSGDIERYNEARIDPVNPENAAYMHAFETQIYPHLVASLIQYDRYDEPIRAQVDQGNPVSAMQTVGQVFDTVYQKPMEGVQGYIGEQAYQRTQGDQSLLNNALFQGLGVVNDLSQVIASPIDNASNIPIPTNLGGIINPNSPDVEKGFREWTEANPEKVRTAYEAGWDTDGDGQPNIYGGDAVWDSYVSELSMLERGAADLGADPWVLAQTGAGALARIPQVARLARPISQAVNLPDDIIMQGLALPFRVAGEMPQLVKRGLSAAIRSGAEDVPLSMNTLNDPIEEWVNRNITTPARRGMGLGVVGEPMPAYLTPNPEIGPPVPPELISMGITPANTGVFARAVEGFARRVSQQPTTQRAQIDASRMGMVGDQVQSRDLAQVVRRGQRDFNYGTDDPTIQRQMDRDAYLGRKARERGEVEVFEEVIDDTPADLSTPPDYTGAPEPEAPEYLDFDDPDLPSPRITDEVIDDEVIFTPEYEDDAQLPVDSPVLGSFDDLVVESPPILETVAEPLDEPAQVLAMPEDVLDAFDDLVPADRDSVLTTLNAYRASSRQAFEQEAIERREIARERGRTKGFNAQNPDPGPLDPSPLAAVPDWDLLTPDQQIDELDALREDLLERVDLGTDEQEVEILSMIGGVDELRAEIKVEEVPVEVLKDGTKAPLREPLPKEKFSGASRRNPYKAPYAAENRGDWNNQWAFEAKKWESFIKRLAPRVDRELGAIWTNSPTRKVNINNLASSRLQLAHYQRQLATATAPRQIQIAKDQIAGLEKRIAGLIHYISAPKNADKILMELRGKERQRVLLEEFMAEGQMDPRVPLDTRIAEFHNVTLPAIRELGLADGYLEPGGKFGAVKAEITPDLIQRYGGEREVEALQQPWKDAHNLAVALDFMDLAVRSDLPKDKLWMQRDARAFFDEWYPSEGDSGTALERMGFAVKMARESRDEDLRMVSDGKPFQPGDINILNEDYRVPSGLDPDGNVLYEGAIPLEEIENLDVFHAVQRASGLNNKGRSNLANDDWHQIHGLGRKRSFGQAQMLSEAKRTEMRTLANEAMPGQAERIQARIQELTGRWMELPEWREMRRIELAEDLSRRVDPSTPGYNDSLKDLIQHDAQSNPMAIAKYGDAPNYINGQRAVMGDSVYFGQLEKITLANEGKVIAGETTELVYAHKLELTIEDLPVAREDVEITREELLRDAIQEATGLDIADEFTLANLTPEQKAAMRPVAEQWRDAFEAIDTVDPDVDLTPPIAGPKPAHTIKVQPRRHPGWGITVDDIRGFEARGQKRVQQAMIATGIVELVVDLLGDGVDLTDTLSLAKFGSRLITDTVAGTSLPARALADRAERTASRAQRALATDQVAAQAANATLPGGQIDLPVSDADRAFIDRTFEKIPNWSGKTYHQTWNAMADSLIRDKDKVLELRAKAAAGPGRMRYDPNLDRSQVAISQSSLTPQEEERLARLEAKFNRYGGVSDGANDLTIEQMRRDEFHNALEAEYTFGQEETRLGRFGKKYDRFISEWAAFKLLNPLNVTRFLIQNYVGNLSQLALVGEGAAIFDSFALTPKMLNEYGVLSKKDDGWKIFDQKSSGPSYDLSGTAGGDMLDKAEFGKYNGRVVQTSTQAMIGGPSVRANQAAGAAVRGNKAARGYKRYKDAAGSTMTAIESSARLALWLNTFQDGLVRRKSDMRLRVNELNTQMDIRLDEQDIELLFDGMDSIFGPVALRNGLEGLGLSRGINDRQLAKFADRAGRDWAGMQSMANEDALKRVNKVLFSYEYNGIDTLARRVIPFHFWATRALPFYAELAVKNPWMVNAYLNMADALEKSAESEGAPPYIRQAIKMLGSPAGYAMFINPISAVGMVSAFERDFERAPDGESWFGKSLRTASTTFGVQLYPWFGALANYTGQMGEANQYKDPTGFQTERRKLGSMVQLMAAQGIWPGDSVLLGAPVEQMLNDFREVTTRYFPGAQTLESSPATASNERDLTYLMMDLIAEREGLDPAEPLAMEHFEEIIDAKENVDSPLFQEALDLYSRSGTYTAFLNSIVPGWITSRPENEGAIREMGEGSRSAIDNAAFEDLVRQQTGHDYEPNSLIPAQERARLQSSLASARPEHATTMYQQTEYQNLGSKNERETIDIYNGIRNGDWSRTVTIGSQLYSPAQLGAMDGDARRELASTWLREDDDRQAEFDSYRSKRETYLEANPEYGAFHRWRDRVFDLPNRESYRQQLVAQNPAARKWVAETRRDILTKNPGITATELTRQLDDRLTSLSAYEAIHGKPATYYDRPGRTATEGTEVYDPLPAAAPFTQDYPSLDPDELENLAGRVVEANQFLSQRSGKPVSLLDPYLVGPDQLMAMLPPNISVTADELAALSRELSYAN